MSNLCPQLLPSLIAALSAISDGMHYGWSAPVFPLLRSKDSPVVITHEDETWLESVYLASAIVGVPLTTLLLKKMGPKRSILVATFITMTAWIVIGFAREVKWLYLGRFLAGMAGNTAYVSIPMYISEIANQNIRGFLVGLNYLMILLGFLVVYSIAPFTPLYVLPLVGVAIAVLQFIVLPLMPESPYYLLYNGKSDQAKLALKRLRPKDNNIEEEIKEIAQAMESQIKEGGRFQDLFLVDTNRKVVVIITVLVLCQHFSGFSIIVMNMHTILIEGKSIYMTSEDTGIAFCLLMVIAATICIFSVDKIGRKALLIISGTLTGLCLLILSIYFTLIYESDVDLKSVSWIPIVTLMAFAVCFKVGLGFLPQLIISELFPSSVKTIGMTLGDIYFTVFSFLSVVFYQYVASNFGLDVPLYVLASIAFISVFFTIWYVPETKGKTLEEIQEMLKERQ